MFQTKSISQIRCSLLAAAIAFATCLFIVPAIQAQDEAAPAAPAAVDPLGSSGVEEDSTNTLWDKIVSSGWFMVPIAALSVWALTLVVFCILQISPKKFVPSRLVNEILGNMGDVRVRSTIDIAAQDPSFLGRLVAHSYPLVDATDPETLGRAKVEDAILDFSVKENSRYMVWVTYFSVIAQGGPMIGLFGTVGGMIMAFDTMGLSKGADPSALASSISLALITTATALVVAIPCIFCFYMFKNRLNKLMGQAQDVALEGLDLAVGAVNADQQLAKVPDGISEE